MSLNNLRRKIVRHLIRPEDGYIKTDTWGGEPMRFYYDRSNGKYYSSIILDGKRNYNGVTLTGWKVYHPDPSQVEEIDFHTWRHGIVDNIYHEYSERLSSISCSELKNFNTNETGVKTMINKQSFCDIVEALDKYWGNIGNLENVLNVYFEDNMLTTIFDKVIDALEDDLEPDRDFGENLTILDWLIEFDAGRDEKAKEGINGHPLTTAAELYDYLVWKRDKKVSENT